MAGNAIVRKEKKLSAATATQSHYIEVLQGAIFMEQNMRFELFLSWLEILKKNGGVKYATFEGVFFNVLMGKHFVFGVFGEK